MGHADFADRPAGGHVVSFERYDFWIDEHEVRIGCRPPTTVETEQVAGLEHERPDLVVSTLVELKLVRKGLWCLLGGA